MRKALISVSDKTGAADFAKELAALGFEVISTGGTFKALKGAGVEVTEVSEITGFPECLDGRLKTLHPKIHGGLLFLRDNPEHVNQTKELGIGAIDIAAVNLYPFKATVLKGAPLAEAIENIDVGGPTMLRAAAKNYRFVSVICDAADYGAVINELKAGGAVSEKTNLYLAAKAFAHTAAYDALIASYLKPLANLPAFPDTLTLTFEKAQEMRYGENPHQAAAFYKEIGDNAGLVPNIKKLHGIELSYNNINDLNGAIELLKEFGDAPAVIAVKHANPCGVGTAGDIAAAAEKAYSCDPKSIYGGIIAANRQIDLKTAELFSKIFLEIIVAPSFSDDAFALLSQKKNIRLIELEGIASPLAGGAVYDVKKVLGGLLIQTANTRLLEGGLKTVTKRSPTDSEIKDLLFVWKIVKHIKSNAIAIGKDGQSLGAGGGQVNRIWALCQAVDHCREALGADVLRGASLASDAFFPFPDNVEAAAEAGITAIIQPGGSKNDADSIACCDKHNIAMVFTGIRHFKH